MLCILPQSITEKAMAPHSSTLAWKIPWMEKPGRLQSMALIRIRHDWAASLSLFTFMHWRRKWQSTPVFLPGESQGWGSLLGCCLWGRTESDTTEATAAQSLKTGGKKKSHCNSLTHLHTKPYNDSGFNQEFCAQSMCEDPFVLQVI